MITSTRIDNIFAGKVETLWNGKPPSAIGKRPVVGRVALATLGLECDAQADLTVHGGPAKALHHYPSEHYPVWCAELNRVDLIPGGFGENIATIGLTEDSVCIGDIFSIGSAKVQISQGRQPCWKLNAHTGEDHMAWRFQDTGRTGWYYRVLEPGAFEVGDSLTLTERPCPDWTVRRVTNARLTRQIEPTDAATLAALVELAQGWRAAFAKMADGDTQEDTQARLRKR